MSVGTHRHFVPPALEARTSAVPWCWIHGEIWVGARRRASDDDSISHPDDGEFLFWETHGAEHPQKIATQALSTVGFDVKSAVIKVGTWVSPLFAKPRFESVLVWVEVHTPTPVDGVVWRKLADIAINCTSGHHYLGPRWAFLVERVWQVNVAEVGGLGVPETCPTETTDHIRLDQNLVIFPVLTPTLAPATHTNCVIIGQKILAVVDPATPYADEQERLLAYLRARCSQGATVACVLVTHHHRDHIGAVSRVAAEFGAQVWAHPETTTRLLEPIVVHRSLADGQVLALDSDLNLTVFHTPGHAPGHCVFWDASRGWMVLGDMVAGEGTIIIAGADGDMAEYLRQLARLTAYSARRAIAAHGPVLLRPRQRLEQARAHRLWRESLILAELMRRSPLSVADLTRAVYPGVADMVLPLAEQQVRAHLDKLSAEQSGISQLGGGIWGWNDRQP